MIEQPISSAIAVERYEELRTMAIAAWSNPDMCERVKTGLVIEAEQHMFDVCCRMYSDEQSKRMDLIAEGHYENLVARESATRRKQEADAEKRGHVSSRILTYEELRSLPKPTPLIWNVAYTGSVGVMLGNSQHGKTWVMLSIAAAAATGLHWPVWRDYPKPSPIGVLYVAAEDGGSIGSRLEDWERAKGERLAERAFHIHPSAINVLDIVQIEELCEVIKDREYRFIVIDTISASLGGEDEGNAEFSRMVKHMRLLVAAMDGQGSVFLVHHYGKDKSKGARGGSALFNDSDIVWELDGDSLDDITMKCSKWKSDSVRKPWRLKLDRTENQLHITANDNGGSVTTTMADVKDRMLTEHILKIITERQAENQGFGPSRNVIMESLRHREVHFRTAELKPRLDYLVAEKTICKQGGARGATHYRMAPVQETAF